MLLSGQSLMERARHLLRMPQNIRFKGAEGQQDYNLTGQPEEERIESKRSKLLLRKGGTSILIEKKQA